MIKNIKTMIKNIKTMIKNIKIMIKNIKTMIFVSGNLWESIVMGLLQNSVQNRLYRTDYIKNRENFLGQEERFNGI